MTIAEATPDRLIAPGLTGVEPPQAAPGHTVTVRGEGGYIVYGEGDTGYNESARSFEITFDGKPVGSLMCYVNFCSADITIPSDASPGTHTIAVETGSAITLEVIAPISPP